MEYEPGEPLAGETVTFDALESEGEIEGYEWTVAGERYTEENISHTLEEGGEYAVGLNVTSDSGYADTTNTTVIVTGTEEDNETTDIKEGEEGNPVPGFGFFAVFVALVGFAAVRIR